MEKKEKIFHTSYRTVYSHYKNVHTLPVSTILNNHPTRKYNKALRDLCVCVCRCDRYASLKMLAKCNQIQWVKLWLVCAFLKTFTLF